MTIVSRSIVSVNLNLHTMNIKERLGLKVKKLREEKGISIEYFANISNVDRTYISDIEKGKRNISIEILEKILKGLGITFEEFFKEGIDE